MQLTSKCTFWSWVQTADDDFDVRGLLQVKGKGMLMAPVGGE